ncbi:MAG TPA: aldehyde dehydrogenase family protein [Chthoniobacterales bacterium]
MESRLYSHFISNEETKGSSKASILRYSPANGQLVASYAEGTVEDAQSAILAARRAFDEGPWPHLSGIERGQLLMALAARLREEKERFAQIEAAEVGKPIKFARGDIEGAILLTTYAAGLAAQEHGESFSNLGPQKHGFIFREPVGVAGLIVPWNFPTLILSQKLPFALAAGCTVVVKPSELTSGTAIELGRLAAEVGIPEGVINIVTGYGSSVGEVLVKSPLVDFVSFTGSTAVGRKVIQNSAETIKRVSVELGGKAANIVFSDADINDAIDGALFGIFFNNGECCCSATRLLVHEDIAADFEAALAEAAGSLKLDSPFKDDTDVGALIHEGHLNKVMDYIESGKHEGGKLLVGGGRETAGACGEGLFVQPTIFSGVKPDMKIFRQEIFGPVLSVSRFRTTGEAIHLANDTEYGLANALWTKNVDIALTTSRALRSGTVWVNTMIDGSPQLPFGGYKASGFGREMGTIGLEEFTQLKTVLFHTGKRTPVFLRNETSTDTVSSH